MSGWLSLLAVVALMYIISSHKSDTAEWALVLVDDSHFYQSF